MIRPSVWRELTTTSVPQEPRSICYWKYAVTKASGNPVKWQLTKWRMLKEQFNISFVFILFQDNLSLFKADPSSAQWRIYVEYIDEMLIDGFFDAIESSLKFFMENTGVLSNYFLSLTKSNYRGFPRRSHHWRLIMPPIPWYRPEGWLRPSLRGPAVSAGSGDHISPVSGVWCFRRLPSSGGEPHQWCL